MHTSYPPVSPARPSHQRPGLTAGQSLLWIAVAVACALPAAAVENLVPCGDFESGSAAAVAAGWRLGGVVHVVPGAAGETAHLRVGCAEPNAGTAAVLTGLKLKANTGYVARYRMRSDGPAHHTFALINPHNSVFLVCRDAYAMSSWNQCSLAFRTADQTDFNLYLGRRYGSGAILYDDVSLVEDNTVRTGDLSPAPHPLPTVTAAESGRGYLLSAQHWMELIFPTYLPLRSEAVTALRCRLAPGEYEPVTLSVTALRPLSGVSVALDGDLQGPVGAILPAAAVQVGVVRTMTRWFNNGAPLKPGQSYERRPMFIFPQTPVNAAEKETQSFWLTVQAPPTARPGIYRTKLRVSAAGAETALLALVVEILPLALPEPDVTYGMYYRQCCQYPEFRTEEFFRRSLADMRAHGCNSVSVYANIERRLPDGTLQTDFDLTGPGHGIGENHPPLNRQMALLGEAGLLQPGHPLLFLATGTSNGIFGNQEKTVAAAQARARAAGWPELLWYLVDEPAAEQRELIRMQAEVVHRVPGARTTTAGVGGGDLGRFYDVWIQGETADMEQVVAEARAQGKQAWAYNCSWNGAQPAMTATTPATSPGMQGSRATGSGATARPPGPGSARKETWISGT